MTYVIRQEQHYLRDIALTPHWNCTRLHRAGVPKNHDKNWEKIISLFSTLFRLLVTLLMRLSALSGVWSTRAHFTSSRLGNGAKPTSFPGPSPWLESGAERIATTRGENLFKPYSENRIFVTHGDSFPNFGQAPVSFFTGVPFPWGLACVLFRLT